MKIEYKKATLKDIPSMQLLVQPEVDSGVILERSDDEIATNIRSYTLAFYGSELIGFSALHIHTSYLAEVRSLIIKENFRGNKIGEGLVLKLLDEARDLGVQKVLALTYKQAFFELMETEARIARNGRTIIIYLSSGLPPR